MIISEDFQNSLCSSESIIIGLRFEFDQLEKLKNQTISIVPLTSFLASIYPSKKASLVKRDVSFFYFVPRNHIAHAVLWWGGRGPPTDK